MIIRKLCGKWIAFYRNNGSPIMAESKDIGDAIRNCVLLINNIDG